MTSAPVNFIFPCIGFHGGFYEFYEETSRKSSLVVKFAGDTIVSLVTRENLAKILINIQCVFN